MAKISDWFRRHAATIRAFLSVAGIIGAAGFCVMLAAMAITVGKLLMLLALPLTIPQFLFCSP